MNVTRLILIRHGQTESNRKKIYSGLRDIKLNGEGRKQAKKLHQRLKNEIIHKVYSSDRRRAIETAKIIFNGKRTKKDKNLREINFGLFEGNTYEENLQKHPLLYQKWLDEPFGTRVPKGESLKNFREKVVKAFHKIAASNTNKNVAVVCHGGTISIFLNDILKKKQFWKYIPESARISVIEYKNGKPKIKLFNDILHLNE